MIRCSSTSCVGDPERGGRGALADPGLQHPQLAALDGELDVAQVPVVRSPAAASPWSAACRTPGRARAGRPG